MAPNATTTHTSTCDYVPEFTGVCCPICAYPITAVDLYFGTPAPIVDKLPKFQQQQQQQTRAVSSPVAEIPVALILPPPVNGRSAVCWSDEELKAAFTMLDQNKDGAVNASELQNMLLNLGIHLREEVIEELIKQAGCKGHGINEAEFMEWMGKLVIGTSRGLPRSHATSSSSSSSSSTSSQGSAAAAAAHLRAQEDSEDGDDVTQDLVAAFTVFDRDGNGYITRDELKLAMDLIGEHMTDAQLDHMLELADIDKDGRINYQEFLRILL